MNTKTNATNFLAQQAHAFDLYNDLTDNHGATDEGGALARRLADAEDDATLDSMIVYLRHQLVGALACNAGL